MNNSILKENENKRLTIRLPLLICFSMYAAWQMGAVFFSGHTLSINGRTPLPIDIGSLTALIATGYILSITFMIILPHLVVWAERITAGVALLLALTLFLPFTPETLALFYYGQCFCCFFMIGFEFVIIVNLFTEKTAIKHLLVAYGIAQAVIAVMQNDIVKVSFSGFRLFSIAALTLMLFFFWRLPVKRKAWPRYVKKEDNLTAPKSFIAGILIIVGLGSFITLFGSTVAESISHGLSVFYISSSGFGIIAFLLWKRFNITPLRSGSILLALGAMGFIAAIVARFVPALSLVACVLLGAGTTCCALFPFFGILIAKRYPSKYIVPAIIGIAFMTVLVHTVLLEALRDNLTALYAVYLVIAVALVIVYLILEPYLLYSFRGKSLISDERATELNEAAKAMGGESPSEDKPIAEKLMPSAVGGLLNAKEISIEDLTDRERQIAQELMSGYNYNEISKRLHISVHTVNTHRKNIYEKFDVHNVPELIALMERLTKTQGEGGGL